MVQALDDPRVEIEGLIHKGTRTPCGGIALDGNQILQRVGNPVQRAPIVAGGNFLFGSVGLLQCQIARDCSVSVELRADFCAAFEIAFCEFDGRKLARADSGAKFADGEIENVVSQHGLARGPFCVWRNVDCLFARGEF